MLFLEHNELELLAEDLPWCMIVDDGSVLVASMMHSGGNGACTESKIGW